MKKRKELTEKKEKFIIAIEAVMTTVLIFSIAFIIGFLTAASPMNRVVNGLFAIKVTLVFIGIIEIIVQIAIAAKKVFFR